MKKALPIIILVILASVTGYVLLENRKKMEEVTSLAERRLERIPVTTYVVTEKQLREELKFSGKLTTDQDLMLMATTQGRVTRIRVNKGDLVTSGQVIAAVESDLYKEQYDVAQSAYEKLTRDVERFRIMAESEAITRQQLEGMELNLKQAEAQYLAAKKQFEDTQITSPVSGYVNQLFVKLGGVVGPGIPVAEIVNNEQLKLSLKISERDMPAIREAETVPVTLGISPRDTINGKVTFTSIKPDYSGLYPVDISIEGADKSYAGQLATAHFTKYSNPTLMYIPQSAILGYGQAVQYVYIAVDGMAKRKEVKPLQTVAEFVAVSGLSMNDKVILKGNTIVSEGQLIQTP